MEIAKKPEIALLTALVGTTASFIYTYKVCRGLEQEIEKLEASLQTAVKQIENFSTALTSIKLLDKELKSLKVKFSEQKESISDLQSLSDIQQESFVILMEHMGIEKQEPVPAPKKILDKKKYPKKKKKLVISSDEEDESDSDDPETEAARIRSNKNKGR